MPSLLAAAAAATAPAGRFAALTRLPLSCPSCTLSAAYNHHRHGTAINNHSLTQSLSIICIYKGDTYLEILAAAKAGAPGIHVHAFSPLEVSQVGGGW